jgi:hypothetical protein
MQTVAEKLEAERQYETFIERVKIQLVEKTKDFEQLREKLIPHDIDQLRIKVQEELEIQHKQQLQSMEQELGIVTIISRTYFSNTAIITTNHLYYCNRSTERFIL